jgi:hypothetical protein
MAGRILNVRPWGALPEVEQNNPEPFSGEVARARAASVQEILNCMNQVPAPAYLAKLRQQVQANARFTENGNRGFKFVTSLPEVPKGNVRRGDVVYHASALPLADQSFKPKRTIVKQKRWRVWSEE